MLVTVVSDMPPQCRYVTTFYHPFLLFRTTQRMARQPSLTGLHFLQEIDLSLSLSLTFSLDPVDNGFSPKIS